MTAIRAYALLASNLGNLRPYQPQLSRRPPRVKSLVTTSIQETVDFYGRAGYNMMIFKTPEPAILASSIFTWKTVVEGPLLDLPGYTGADPARSWGFLRGLPINVNGCVYSIDTESSGSVSRQGAECTILATQTLLLFKERPLGPAYDIWTGGNRLALIDTSGHDPIEIRWG